MRQHQPARSKTLANGGTGTAFRKRQQQTLGREGDTRCRARGVFSLCSPMRDAPLAATRSAHAARVRARSFRSSTKPRSSLSAGTTCAWLALSLRSPPPAPPPLKPSRISPLPKIDRIDRTALPLWSDKQRGNTRVSVVQDLQMVLRERCVEDGDSFCY